MSTSEEMAAYIAKLSSRENISEVTLKTLEECKKDYDRNKKIPAEEYTEYVILQSKAESIWEDAKASSDFEMFQPYLEKLVEMNKRFISYWGYEGNKYNTLLDMYEPGVTVDTLDQVFGQLREKIDLLLLNVPNYMQMQYHYGMNHTDTVIKNGEVVVKGGSLCYQQ